MAQVHSVQEAWALCSKGTCHPTATVSMVSPPSLYHEFARLLSGLGCSNTRHFSNFLTAPQPYTSASLVFTQRLCHWILLKGFNWSHIATHRLQKSVFSSALKVPLPRSMVFLHVERTHSYQGNCNPIRPPTPQQRTLRAALPCPKKYVKFRWPQAWPRQTLRIILAHRRNPTLPRWKLGPLSLVLIAGLQP